MRFLETPLLQAGSGTQSLWFCWIRMHGLRSVGRTQVNAAKCYIFFFLKEDSDIASQENSFAGFVSILGKLHYQVTGAFNAF